jgi:putative FmdB family regulatory protein
MTYEYVCEACGHQWEAQQSIKDSPLKKCVSCGVDKAKRLVSGGTGFLLKGGGWYADLYGSPGSGAGKNEDKSSKAASTKPESASKPDGSASTGAGSGGGDGKPAASSTPSSSGTSTSSSSSSSAAS